MRISKNLESIKKELFLIIDLIIDETSKNPKEKRLLNNIANQFERKETLSKTKKRKKSEKKETSHEKLLSLFLNLAVEKISKGYALQKKLKAKTNKIRIKRSKEPNLTKIVQVEKPSKQELEPTISIYNKMGEELFLSHMAELKEDDLFLICKQELGLKPTSIKKMNKQEKIQLIVENIKKKLSKGHYFLSSD